MESGPINLFEYYVDRDRILKKVASLFKEFLETKDPLERGYVLMSISKELDDAGLYD